VNTLGEFFTFKAISDIRVNYRLLL